MNTFPVGGAVELVLFAHPGRAVQLVRLVRAVCHVVASFADGQTGVDRRAVYLVAGIAGGAVDLVGAIHAIVPSVAVQSQGDAHVVFAGELCHFARVGR